MESVLERGAQSPGEHGRKRKYTTTFTPEDRAAIGRYATENGNAATVKKFKASHSIGETPMRLFKNRSSGSGAQMPMATQTR